jgi:hypothetical protein
MSTDYRLYCLDCDNQEAIHASYSPVRIEEARDILSKASVFALLGDLDESEYVIHRDSDRGPRIRWQWFVKHHGHRLRIISEYGEVDGQCSKDISCSACGDVRYHACKLDVDHAGPCSPVAAKSRGNET